MTKRRVSIIGVPLDLGAGRRGVDMGPSALRVADVDQRIRALGYEVEWHEYPVGHAVCMEEIGELNTWLRRVLA